MKKILIAGGAGFIGSNLTRLFLEKGYSVWVVDNFVTSSKENIAPLEARAEFTFHKVDITDWQELRKVRLPSFDIIYHLASPASPKQYVKLPLETLMANSQGTHNLLEMAKSTDTRIFVFASTSEVYGDPKVHPQKESYWGNVNPVGRRACYDEGKRFGEALCMTYMRKFDVDVRVARIFNTYGPNMEKDDGRVISNFIVQALQNKDLTVYGNGLQTRSFVFVSDMVEGLVALGQKPIKGEIINLGSTEEQTILNIARFIIKLTGSKSKIVFKPLPEDDPQRRRPDLSKAKKILGYGTTVPLETGLKSTTAYFAKRFSL